MHDLTLESDAHGRSGEEADRQRQTGVLQQKVKAASNALSSSKGADTRARRSMDRLRDNARKERDSTA